VTSISQGPMLRDVLEPSQIARGRPGSALVLGPRNELGWVRTVPFFEDPRLRHLQLARERSMDVRSR
jgi:hypothetical protein